MSDQINSKLMAVLEELDLKTENSLIVLKGFPLSIVGESELILENMLRNKFSYFMHLVQSGRSYILYEEFICLYEFLIQQFNSINIIDNNMYINLYPLYANVDGNIIKGLKTHFDSENQNGDTEIGDLSEYVNLYSNLIEIDNVNFIVYNESSEQLKNEKIRVSKLYEINDNKLEVVELGEVELTNKPNFIDISDETDYVKLIKMLFNHPEEIYILRDNSALDKSQLNNQLKLLNGMWNEWTDMYLCKVRHLTSPKSSNNEFKQILKTYWEKGDFRKLPIYDFTKLEEGTKEVVEITQEYIISDLVNEIENCRKGINYRDLFVTAPTGAGKSAMFQIPAIYIAEKYDLVTLVISPLIGLMNDQVKNLEIRNYQYARTINSDIAPVIRQEIIDEVASKKCHILYLSPESLLSRSDVEQLIGNRAIGMIVIDEAHIATTWGKQFRPDYWYLGDHIRKLRKAQRENERIAHPFVIATFTATAIYGGLEDMYQETVNSLHMRRPITYLGFVKRDDIEIEIKERDVVSNKTEYELEKFNQLIEQIERACITNKKTLIYFPTVALIDRFHDYCYNKNLGSYVTKYHGQLDGLEKRENYEQFLSGERIVMLATKAFGMGIDIEDIEIVSHFAPTGNVCDYVQEIGRAARKPKLLGEAVYSHMKSDFKHINRLHGLSTIRSYQLVEVIKKVYELYRNNLMQQDGDRFTKKRNEMLVDAESFAYIFDGPMSDESEVMNKVKTAMLIIQKDYENRQGFSPFHVRPIPMFATGFFAIPPQDQLKLNSKYNNAVEELVNETNICKVDLKKIWEGSFNKALSFPKFKFLLYTKNSELSLSTDFRITPALSVDVFLEGNGSMIFNKILNAVRDVISHSVYEDKYYSQEDIAKELHLKLKESIYKMRSIVSILIAAMDSYKKSFATGNNNNLYIPKPLKNGDVKYRFNNPVEQFFRWLEKGFDYIKDNIAEDKLYLINEGTRDRCREYTTILGILESFGVLNFKALGGANSQIYIYVNQTKSLQMVMNKPYTYKNKLLETVGDRHNLSVAMLSYLFQNNFTNEEMWNYIEDYFLGKIPEKVKNICKKEYDMVFDE